MSPSESEVRAFFDDRSEAMRTKDLDRLMSFYSHDIAYFDVVPPLRYDGSVALRERFSEWFDGWDGPIRQEISDARISVSGDLAVGWMLIRGGGTLKSGQEVDLWLRATSSCVRSDQGWLITHEHISVPVDLRSGSAVTDLTP